MTARNLQKSHTKKPTKPTEWTIRRPSVGQKIQNNMLPRTRPKARGSDGLEQVEHLLCPFNVFNNFGTAGFELPTLCLEAVRPTLPNLARGVANRADSASWGKFPQPALSFLLVVCRLFAAVFRTLRYIFVTAGSRVRPSFFVNFFRL